ncbi:MAG: ABC transporter substrate-binding protein [Chloroflexota bacterium]
MPLLIRRNRVATVLAALVTAAAALTAGCSPGAPDPGSSPSPAETRAPSPTPTVQTPVVTPTQTATPTVEPTATATPATEPPTATPAETATPTPRPAGRGGVLKTAVETAGQHFDIHREVSPAISAWGIGLIYNRLFRYTDEREGPLVECELCESWEMPDIETLRVTMRQDVYWHDKPPLDGRRVTAHDVVFSYNRQKQDSMPNRDLLRNVEFAALDDRTIEFTVSRPDSDLLLNLADGRSRIVAREAVAENGNLEEGPNVGTGPWVWDSTTRGHSVSRYKRNDDYFEPGLPYLDGLEVHAIPENRSRRTAFQVGVMDATDATAAQTEETLEKKPDTRVRTVLYPGAGAEVAINASTHVLSDIRVRKAVFSMMDPWGDQDTIWGGDGRVTLGMPIPRDSWLLLDEQMRGDFNNPERARRLVQEADITPGTEIEITVGRYGDDYLELAEDLAEKLRSLGFIVPVEEVTRNAFVSDYWRKGGYQILIGPQAPVDGLNDDLFSVYHSQGQWNTTGYHTDELDRLIERQAVEMEPSKRRDQLREIQTLTLEGAHRITVAARLGYWLSQPYVHGFEPNIRRGDNHFLANVWIDEDARED